MCGHYRYTLPLYDKVCFFKIKLYEYPPFFILLIISIAQKLHPRINMIQDLKNDFKNDLCDTLIALYQLAASVYCVTLTVHKHASDFKANYTNRVWILCHIK